jgi:hypothetical protein
MSKYMQIDLRLLPFYEKRFRKLFPNISNLLMQLGYHELVETEISLYDLVDHLVTISRSPHTPSHLKETLSPHISTLLTRKRAAREHLLGRRLNELDKVLYELEDDFEELEEAL